ncbi:neuropeptides capa receptor-like [Prorops nasuta]|uniref:neuropeptides capa receptor-like n=1 Tax=Prorops nasuta TaxID=863751 RepID=UPI0034CF503D
MGVENLTESQYLVKVLGPKYLPLQLLLPMTLAYVLIFVTGIIGNIATCIVIVKNTSMHTATNYYLFSLAISDLTLLLLGLPNELNVVWQQYPWLLGIGLCKIRAFVSEMSSYVSVLTIVAFSLERYMAICKPFRLQKMSQLKRPLHVIMTVWLIALVAAVPFAIYTTVNYVEYPEGSGNYSKESAICAMLLPCMPNFPLYELSCTFFFLIPMLVILFVYAKMGLEIRRSVREQLGSVHRDVHHIQSRKSIIRMLSAVVIMFFVCWAPFHTQRLLYIYAQESDFYPDLNEVLYILSGCLYYFSTTVNPILYNLMSAKYRTAFKQTICRDLLCKRRWTRRSQQSCRCSFDDQNHTSSTKSSVGYTINQVAEMFKLVPSRIEVDDNSNNNDNTRGKRSALKMEDSTSRPLLSGADSVIQEETTITSKK